MINIDYQSREFTKVEKYLMTAGQDNISLKDLEDGTSIPVSGIMTFEDIDEETGERNELCSIIDHEKNVYVFQSATATRSLLDIASIMEGEPFSVIKFSGKTKAGRDFVNLKLDTTGL